MTKEFFNYQTFPTNLSNFSKIPNFDVEITIKNHNINNSRDFFIGQKIKPIGFKNGSFIVDVNGQESFISRVNFVFDISVNSKQVNWEDVITDYKNKNLNDLKNIIIENAYPEIVKHNLDENTFIPSLLKLINNGELNHHIFNETKGKLFNSINSFSAQEVFEFMIKENKNSENTVNYLTMVKENITKSPTPKY